MDFDLNNVRSSLDDDRLSVLPLELILQIFSHIDSKLAIQTCLLLFPRWKLIWTLMPCLNFSRNGFKTLDKFSEFVAHVLSHRNHQVEVSSINLCFRQGATQDFVREITNYAISHNVQELILDIRPKNEFPPYLFRSHTLKHLTLRTSNFDPCLTPKTPWDFPVLTTLYLKDIVLCDDRRESVDLFSKCVNLQNLTLENVTVEAKVFEIITPRLANLRLVYYAGYNVINVIAHQLENLTIIEGSFGDLNISSGLSSFCYKGYLPSHSFKYCLNYVKKVTIRLRFYGKRQEDALRIIKMLQELHSVRFLTLNFDIVKDWCLDCYKEITPNPATTKYPNFVLATASGKLEKTKCISSFPELLSTQPSPFRNLISLNINCGMRNTCKFEMSTEARNFFFENSPNATFSMKVPTPSTSTQVSTQCHEV